MRLWSARSSPSGLSAWESDRTTPPEGLTWRFNCPLVTVIDPQSLSLMARQWPGDLVSSRGRPQATGAVVTAAALAITVYLAQTERKRDAKLRRQDREREDQLRREADEKWKRRRRNEQRQREDDDAQQQVSVE